MPMWTEEEERYVSRIIGDVRDRLVTKQEKVTGQDIVFETIYIALDIERRQFVSGLSPRQLRAMYIAYTREGWEVDADVEQRWIDITAGDPFDLVFGIKTEASPLEVSTMDAVNVVFKQLLKGDKQDRDWKILLSLTVPNASLRRIGKIFHVTHTRVATIKVVQCQSIWEGIKHMLPGRQLESDGGEIWWNKEVA